MIVQWPQWEVQVGVVVGGMVQKLLGSNMSFQTQQVEQMRIWQRGEVGELNDAAHFQLNMHTIFHNSFCGFQLTLESMYLD